MRKLIYPLAPGLIYEDKIHINPDLNSLSSFIKNRDFILCCYGGILETYYTLMYTEYLSLKFKDKKFYWVGNNVFNTLIKSNSICKVLNQDINKDHILKANIPFLSDEENKYCIINPLYTYLKINKKGRFIKDSRNFIAQINNTFIKSPKDFFPKLRDKRIPESYNKWKLINKINDENNIIMIFPDVTGWSMHSDKFLEWTPNEVRSFTSMMYGKGYKIYVVTNKQNLYYGLSNAKILPLDFDLIFYLLQKAKYLVSNEVDWIYIYLMITSGKVFCKNINKGPFGLYKTLSYVGIESYKRVDAVSYPKDIFSKIIK